MCNPEDSFKTDSDHIEKVSAPEEQINDWFADFEVNQAYAARNAAKNAHSKNKLFSEHKSEND